MIELGIANVLEYNILHGKKFRGLLPVLTYKNVVKDVTAENLKLAQILGWCLELLGCLIQTFSASTPSIDNVSIASSQDLIFFTPTNVAVDEQIHLSVDMLETTKTPVLFCFRLLSWFDGVNYRKAFCFTSKANVFRCPIRVEQTPLQREEQLICDLFST
uniref:Uncharacterized protein n=1 Tax=Glossina pallidipes TaxID=7398 RepID=A0A1A9ZYN8_GLOPL